MQVNNSDPMGGRDQRPQVDEAAANEAMAQEMFGEKAHLATMKTTGSGTSETTTISAPLAAVFEDYENTNIYLRSSEPWAENRAMIVKLMGPILDRARTCPGLNSEQCCHAEAGRSCFPRWREKGDPEWYALQIHRLVSNVDARIAAEGKLVPALAADEAFELGCLFQEALISFRWDKAAKVGEKVIGGGRAAGNDRRFARDKRLGYEETIAAVDAYLV